MSDIIKEKKLINLNSEDAQSYNGTFKSNLIFNFSDVLTEQKDVVFVEGGIYQASIPASFYATNIYNNILYYTINNPSPTQYFITIPTGNYNFTTYSTAMTARFLLNGHNITLSINKNNGIVTWTYTGADTLYSFDEVNSTSWLVNGFTKGSGDVLASTNTITAPHPLNLLGVKKIKIFSDTFGVSSIDSKNLQTTNLIDTLSVDVPAYGLIIHSNSDGTYGRITKKSINQIDIQLKDELNNFLNFNNVDFSITMCLIIYRKLNIYDNNLETLKNINETLINIQEELTPQPPPDEQPPDEEPPSVQIEGNPTYDPDIYSGGMNDLELLLYENPNLRI
jgi:hypothetical protein